MRTRLMLVTAVALAGAAALPALAAPSGSTPPVPPACVVVVGPSGATVQVGYAPGGPGGCTTLP